MFLAPCLCSHIIMENSRDIKVAFSMKGKILKWLKKIKLRSEEITELIQVPETDTIDILNNLVDQNLIRLIKYFFYFNS